MHYLDISTKQGLNSRKLTIKELFHPSAFEFVDFMNKQYLESIFYVWLFTLFVYKYVWIIFNKKILTLTIPVASHEELFD